MFFESRGKRHDGESDDPVRLWIDAQDVTLVIFNVLAFDVFGVFQRHVQDIRGSIICNRHNERLAGTEKKKNKYNPHDVGSWSQQSVTIKNEPLLHFRTL